MEQDSNSMLCKCNELLQEMSLKDKLIAIGYFRQYALQSQNINIPTSIINYCILFCDLMYKRIHYTWIDCDILIPHYPTIYGVFVPKNAVITTLKSLVAEKHDVEKDELFVCDLWKSKIHRELRSKNCAGVVDINKKSDDIFIYRCKIPNLNEYGSNQKKIDDPKKQFHDRFQTFVINNQHRVPARQQNMHEQQRWEDEPIGYPLLITLPMKIEVTINQIRNQLWGLIRPFLHNENLILNDDELPFQFWSAWGFNNHMRLRDSEEIFDLNQRNLKFLIHWADTTQYKSELYERQNRIKHKSAE